MGVNCYWLFEILFLSQSKVLLKLCFLSSLCGKKGARGGAATQRFFVSRKVEKRGWELIVIGY